MTKWTQAEMQAVAAALSPHAGKVLEALFAMSDEQGRGCSSGFLIKDRAGLNEAEFEAAMNELLAHGLIEPAPEKAPLFRSTHADAN